MERRKTALVVSPDGTSIAMGLGEDWQAVLAESALIALRLATEGLDLVIVSDDMPEGGPGLLRALRHRVGPAVPAIMVGGSWAPGFVEAAIGAGATDVVVCPAPGEIASRAMLATHGRNADRSGLLALAYTDELTGLPNRRFLVERLAAAIKTAHARIESLSVLLLDIDRFKQINDRFGHLVGDRALTEFAKVLKASSRSTDVIGRWGGEEFLYILPGPLSAAEAQAERVRTAVAAFPFGAPEVDMQLTVSIGVTELLTTDVATELVDRADRLLYQAKGEGRDRTIAGRVA